MYILQYIVIFDYIVHLMNSMCNSEFKDMLWFVEFTA